MTGTVRSGAWPIDETVTRLRGKRGMKMSAPIDSILPNAPRLAGRRIVITGAASGMGAAIAELFASEGATLTLFDVQREALAAVAARCGATPTYLDVSSENEVGRAISDAEAGMGGIDGVVNAAGILKALPIVATSSADWRRIHEVNLFGPFLVCRAAIPALERASDVATIVNIASMGGIKTPPFMAAYAASKAGLIALTEGIAIEHAPKIRANSLCPGIIRTPMTDALEVGRGAVSDDVTSKLVGLGRKGTPLEVAYLALFLTSRESAFISGAVYTIDGGPPNPALHI